MKISDFTFNLPQELIAQTPAMRRGQDRLLVIDRQTGKYSDEQFTDFPSFVDSDSIIVVNDTKVRKARVFGTAETGGRVEFLFTGAISSDKWQAMVSKSRKQKVGKKFDFYTPEGEVFCRGEIDSNVEDDDSGSALKIVKFDREVDESFFSVCGHVPLPPYIKREDDFNDEQRYQTIFADECGSMACPTAGLHFTQEIIDCIEKKGIKIVHITLHVGMGTFLPVRTENLEDHVMHTESYHISDEAAKIINQAKADGKKILAVGTTSVRTLESAFDTSIGLVRSGYASTSLFIKPGFTFNVVDQILTNFHTPESTLLVLVSAFAGREHILEAYKHAVQEKYRFFSYGDATFLR